MHSVTLMPLVIIVTVEVAATVLLNLFNASHMSDTCQGKAAVRYLKQAVKAEFIPCHLSENYGRCL